MTQVLETVSTKPYVGQILYSSWGYDQTNIEFFKVVKVSASSVWIQKVGSEITEITGWAHQNVIPTDSSEYQVRDWDTNEYVTKTYAIKQKRIQTKYAGENGWYVNLNSYASAFPWDGKPKGQSQTC
jgi:hypothetical protein